MVVLDCLNTDLEYVVLCHPLYNKSKANPAECGIPCIWNRLRFRSIFANWIIFFGGLEKKWLYLHRQNVRPRGYMRLLGLIIISIIIPEFRCEKA